LITCQHCRYFRPAASNPATSMGRCYANARHGFFYPMEKHTCRDYSDSVKKPEAPKRG